MPVPKSVTKINKNGVAFISNVDAAQYTLTELIRAANRDVGKYLRKMAINKARERRGLRKSKRPYKAFGYWARKKETDLQVGIKHDTWFGADQELGSNNQPKHSILRDSVYENIPKIREIQAQYLSAINDSIKAQALINEEDYADNGDEEI